MQICDVGLAHNWTLPFPTTINLNHLEAGSTCTNQMGLERHGEEMNQSIYRPILIKLDNNLQLL